MKQYDAIIIGAGLVGLTTALALGYKGLSVAVIDRMDPKAALAPDFDLRASAISASSFTLFKNLGLETALWPHVQPMHHIVIADGTVGNVSPLTLQFERDADAGPSGYMIKNTVLRRALLSAVKASKSISLFAPTQTRSVKRGASEVTVVLDDDSTLIAPVLIAADGRQSRTRQEAGIGVDMKAYKQSALVATLEHTRPHQGTAYEIFYPTGPFALLPLQGNQSSLVWSDKPQTLKAATELPLDALSEEIERRTNGLLGEVTLVSPALTYPLSLQIAEHYTSERLALVGDAAHVIHPIAGQGLNMGLRDAAALTDVLFASKSAGLDLGGANLSDYGVWRNFDNRTLAMATDLLNHLFSNKIPALAHARRIGMTLVQGLSPLQKTFTREAAGELGTLPSLMREN